jgi:hypothetical protein
MVNCAQSVPQKSVKKGSGNNNDCQSIGDIATSGECDHPEGKEKYYCYHLSPFISLYLIYFLSGQSTASTTKKQCCSFVNRTILPP